MRFVSVERRLIGFPDRRHLLVLLVGDEEELLHGVELVGELGTEDLERLGP